MAKFRYRMQNILEIKEKMEEQEKVAYGIANARLLEEQEKLQKLFVRKAGYEARLKELTSAKLAISRFRCAVCTAIIWSRIMDLTESLARLQVWISTMSSFALVSSFNLAS